MTQTATATQAHPVAGVWDADPAHSTVDFVARHLMATKVRGHFAEWTATLTTGSHPGEAKVQATLQAASITTGSEQRDGHLRSPDFFEVDKYPTLDFVSTKISDLDADGHFTVTGDLTAHGVTAPVTLDVEFGGMLEQDPFGKTRISFSATADIDRETWGLKWNQPLAGGGFVVSKTIKTEIEVAFTLRVDAQ